MTQGQKSDYDEYGCMSKALTKLAERRGKPIAIETYCERFEKFFHPKYGALTTSALFEVAKELKLCSRAHTFANPEMAKRIFRESSSSSLFMITEKYCIGEYCPPLPNYMHARLVLNYRKDEWILWNDYHDNRGEETVQDKNLCMQIPHFIHLSD